MKKKIIYSKDSEIGQIIHGYTKKPTTLEESSEYSVNDQRTFANNSEIMSIVIDFNQNNSPIHTPSQNEVDKQVMAMFKNQKPPLQISQQQPISPRYNYRANNTSTYNSNDGMDIATATTMATIAYHIGSESNSSSSSNSPTPQPSDM